MKNQELENLINRYFRGQLDDDEYRLLTEFLYDKDNLELFDKAKQQWEQNPDETENSRRNWFRLYNHIHTRKPVSKGISRRLWFRVASVAATLLVGLFLGSIVTRYISGTGLFSQPLVFETPRGEKSMMQLPDGSKVWLNANSKLTCHTFTSRSRDVELSGEAFFKVAHNKKSPFRVKTNECEVEVLGTEFNVMAYDNFGRKEITLLSGRVDVHLKNTRQVLTPGKAMIIKDNKSWITKTDAVRATAWTNNKFDFQNIPLSELVKRLENWYDIDINLSNPDNKEVNFSGTFKNEETIWQVLDAIKVYMPIRYKKTDLRKIKITVE
jgi:transmembrane sensor